MNKIQLSVVIIAKNEQEMITDCLKSAIWADEVVFIDTGSTDATIKIATQYPVRIIKKPTAGLAYADWRNIGLRQSKGKWLFYLDADERITPELRKEMEFITSRPSLVSAYAVPRRNFLLGKELHWGGWWPDYVKRLYRKEKLEGWRGKLHEEPVFSSKEGSASGGEGELGHLKNPLIHLQPNTIEPMLEKTIRWSKIEAGLLYKANHPPVVWWRILRMGATTLFDRLVKKQGFRDGTEGWIESIYQAFHTMIVYMQLWEMQRNSELQLTKD